MNTMRSRVLGIALLLCMLPAFVFAATISGSIIDENWELLTTETIEVSVAPYQSEDWQSVTTSDGLYSFTGLSAGTYWVYARSLDTNTWYVSAYYPGVWFPMWAAPIDLEQNSEWNGLDIMLNLGGRISGSVTPAEGGAFGDNDVAVGLFMGFEGGEGWGLTNPSDFVSPPLPSGEFSLRFFTQNDQDYHVAMYSGNTWDPFESQPVTIQPGETMPVGDYELPLGGAVEGVVLGEGEPLGGAMVNVFLVTSSPMDPWRYFTAINTSPDGVFRVRGVPAQTSVVLEVMPPPETPYSPQWYDHATSPEEATPIAINAGVLVSGIEIDLQRGASIFGTLRMANGTIPGPFEFFEFTACSEWGDNFWLDVQLDDEGNWSSTSAVPPGVYTLYAVNHNMMFDAGVYLGNTVHPWEADWVELGAGENAGPFDLRLAAGGAISGAVLDPDGNSVPNASLALYENGRRMMEQYVNWDGTFTFQNVPPGDYAIEAVQEEEFDPENSWPVIYSGGSPTLNGAEPVTVVANQVTGVSIQFQEGTLVTITATDAEGNAINPWESGVGIAVLPVTSDGDIAWNVRSDIGDLFVGPEGMRCMVPEGEWTFVAVPVFASGFGVEPRSLRRTFLGGSVGLEGATILTLTAGVPETAAIQVPETGHEISGHLSTVTGRQLQYLPTVLVVDEFGHPMTAAVDFDGSAGSSDYRIAGIPDGSYRVFAFPEGDVNRYVGTWYPEAGAPGSSNETVGDWPEGAEVVQVNGSDVANVDIVMQTGSGSVGVKDLFSADLPRGYSLSPAWPNPFNASATISYTVPKTSKVRIDLVNVLGRRVATLEDRPVSAGAHRVTLQGEHLPSGVYFVRMEAGSFRAVQKVSLVK